MKSPEQFQQEAEQKAEFYKELQDQVALLDAEQVDYGNGAVQAGERDYPEPPLPRQHLDKPGEEADLNLKPMYDAPFYEGSGKLTNKIAVITGGDSGIGRSVAVLFAREGADVVVVYLNEHEDAEETRAMVQLEGRQCRLLPGDVSDPEFCNYVIEETLQVFGRLDVLVNNSAFQLHVPDISVLSTDHFDTTLKANLYGYFYMIRAAVPHLKPGSAIVNTGSVTGMFGSAGIPDYSLTKGGIHAFTRALGMQLAPRGIRVNAVAPGPVWTPLNPADKEAEKIVDFGAKTPMKRPAQPEEIAPAYVFLASSHCSSYITGEVLPIIGGYSL